MLWSAAAWLAGWWDAGSSPSGLIPGENAHNGTGWFCGVDSGDSGCVELRDWWLAMVAVCAVINLALLVVLIVKIPVASGDSYGWWMKVLAVPWVLECGWRTVFPSLYLQRRTLWNTPLNSILVDRTLACVGELANTVQLSLALRHIDEQVTGKTPWVQVSGWAAIGIYVVAECVSYYNVATTNEFWAAAEVIFDATAYLVMAPAAVWLLIKCPGKVLESSAKAFLVVFALFATALPAYNFFIDAPMYMERYRDDQAANKTYFDFLPGLYDAATTRVVSHRWDDWSQDLFWMTAYFGPGAWAGMVMMFAPRLRGHLAKAALAAR